MEILKDAPAVTTFIPLAEHQSTTPASFYTGPTVLHYYSDRSKVIVISREVENVPALKNFVEKSESAGATAGTVDDRNGGSEGRENGNGMAESDEKITLEEVDVWVTSDKLFLYSDAAATGVSIPYPSISLHAIQSLPTPSAGEQQGVYMQVLSTSGSADQSGDDVDMDSISITVIPTASAPPATATEDYPAEEKPELTPVVAMFNALSNCSNLHPDPVEDEDEEMDGMGGSRLFRAGLAIPGDASGGMPPAMPGSGGWITAENMHEFVDENGNWIEQDEEHVDMAEDQDGEVLDEPLGPGAGTVRTRGENGAEGASGDADDETKWRRTS